MAIDVCTETVISRPPAAVAEFAANPDNAPAWYANIHSVDWRTSPPLGAGTRVAFVARFLGRRMAYTYEVVEWVPGSRLVMRTAEGPFPMETTYTWEAAGANRYPDGPAQPRHAIRLPAPRVTAAGDGRAACQHKGP